jgi:exodeoxyribonuclease III
MKIATWNVNGIRARQAQVLEWLDRDRPDVVCLQEIKAKPEQVPEALCNLPGYWCYWHGAGGYSGVGLHLRKETFAEKPDFSHPHFDNETRIVQAKAGNLVFASVYVPNGGKDYAAKIEFLNEMRGYVRAMHDLGNQLVLCGDINIARADMDVHPKERKPRIIGQLPEERAQLERIIGHGLVDVGRELEPENDQMFTWWAPWRNMRQRNIGWRLDYVLASRGLFERVGGCTVQRDVGTSDHAPVVATFA